MVQKTVLDNGVRLLSERQDSAYSVTVGIWMEVGSRDELPSQGGVSHFIEHMAFKGTARRGPLEIALEIDRLGGMANAFTSKENTCYHARALSEHLPELSDLLSDLLLRPALIVEELERERQVILQEIGSVEDTPDELVHLLFAQNFWPDHSLGRSVLGTVETVSALSRRDIVDYMGGTYLPCGLVVAAVGKLEHQELVDLLAPVLGESEPAPSCLNRTPPAPAAGLHLLHRELEQVHLVLGQGATSAVDPDRFACAMLNLILGGSMSSRLFQEVREKRGLAYAVYSFLNSYSDSGLLGVYLGVAPGRAAEALHVVRAEMARLAAEPVGPDELAHAKDNMRSSLLLAAESPEQRMYRLARSEYNFGRPVPLEEVVESIEAVSAEDISALAGRLLDPAGLGVTVLGPADQDALHKEMAS